MLETLPQCEKIILRKVAEMLNLNLLGKSINHRKLRHESKILAFSGVMLLQNLSQKMRSRIKKVFSPESLVGKFLSSVSLKMFLYMLFLLNFDRIGLILYVSFDVFAREGLYM